jgi:glucose-6-phosphate 1-dehydrogenase
LIVHRLDEAGMAEGNRIVIEKPFGSDLASARALSAEIHRAFDESRVFRIDHYLGKETVQNLLVFRFANSLFERVWNRDAVDHVQITVAESSGIGKRAGYYEEAGVVRDMVQNHLMQLLSFLAMDPPRSFEPEAIRDEKVKLLRAVRPFDPGDTVSGQYRHGRVGSEDAAAYRDEPGVADGSNTSTFASVRARIDNWRWDRVPFYLRTGKRLPRRVSEIMVVFKEVPAYLHDEIGSPPADHLVIRVQPEEGISFSFQAKRPGAGLRPKTVKMGFSYSEEFQADPVDAYERLMEDAMRGDPTLFTRADEVERAWEIVSALLGASLEPEPYDAGSWGPAAADDQIAPRRWHLHE